MLISGTTSARSAVSCPMLLLTFRATIGCIPTTMINGLLFTLMTPLFLLACLDLSLKTFTNSVKLTFKRFLMLSLQLHSK
jgi:hypothetical protein